MITIKQNSKLFYSIILLSSVFILGGCNKDLKQSKFPGEVWEVYADPEDAGWSAERLTEAKKIFKEVGSNAFMVIHDGAILTAWGDIERRYMCHSVRKSYLSALIGMYVDEGIIDTSKTIAELNINDTPPLTNVEKTAKIIHLLKSRSGIYHSAAYETEGMKKRRPERGSKVPGEFWYYNNWDFNALRTIFEQETGKEFFTDFKTRLSEPLQMEDFRLMDTYYHLEAQHSIHPAYPFRMSARDMARFGLLYLRQGKWNDQQLINPKWVQETGKPYSEVTNKPEYGYGYMWWVYNNKKDRKHGMYYAQGYGGHVIAVLPSENLVIINRANTYLGKIVGMSSFNKIVDVVLEAKISEPVKDPKYKIYSSSENDMQTESKILVIPESILGNYILEKEEIFVKKIPYLIGDIIGKEIYITKEQERLMLKDSFGQKYYLQPLSETEFIVEDMKAKLSFILIDDKPVEFKLIAEHAWELTGKPLKIDQK